MGRMNALTDAFQLRNVDDKFKSNNNNNNNR